ncbi:MAG: hypothetical protein NVSMB52_18930 [Chloroflexota bacterium]
MTAGETIIVIEDEPAILAMMREMLQEEGYAVIGVAHPRDVPTIDEDLRPALLFVDLMLPQISGITLARELREDGFPETPMIAMSASSTMLESAAKSKLFQKTLAKPFDVSQLLDYAEHYAGAQRAS